jgi:hypothetical protein
MKIHVNKRGITLIALIVTIIVLLMLAGVSVSLALGEKGVVTKAENATKTSKEVQIQEDFKTAYVKAMSEGYDLLGDEEFINKIKGESYFISDISSITSNGTTNTSSGNVEYTVQFLDYNGKTVFWSTIVDKGSSVTYGGSTPTRASDGTYSYTFDTWVTSAGGTESASEYLSNIQSDTTVYAAYTATRINGSSSTTGGRGSVESKDNGEEQIVDPDDHLSTPTVKDGAVTENHDEELSWPGTVDNSGDAEETTIPTTVPGADDLWSYDENGNPYIATDEVVDEIIY